MNIERMELLQNEWSDTYIKSNKRQVLNVAPRTGKISTAIKIWRKLGWEYWNKRILISYPDNKILNSWEDDIKKFDFQGCKIHFTNTASLSKYIGERWDMYTMDECHELSDREKSWAKSICRNSTYVLGLSGTINKRSELTLRSLGLPILIKYSIEQAVKDEIISEYEIYIHYVQLDTKGKTKNSKGKLVTEKQRWDNYTYVVDKMKLEGASPHLINIALSRRKAVSNKSIAKRNKIIQLLDELKDKRLLVFTGLQEVAENLNIPFYHSNSKNEESFQRFIKEEIPHLAMANIGGVGVTYRNMDAIILSNFTNNEENTEQIIARSLVMDYKEKIAKIHILCLNEKPEIDKLQKTLKNFNKSKIKYGTQLF